MFESVGVSSSLFLFGFGVVLFGRLPFPRFGFGLGLGLRPFFI
jgi:hypothetical protein